MLKRKFSIFVSSTYEDLKEERQALMGVAIENDFIPVGMEQFHAAPANQWDVITKMIDQCDFYLLIIGGRYGSIDEKVNKSYTEKEYDYAKSKGMPVLVLMKRSESITEDKKDTGENKYDKMERLESFRKKVQNDQNTVAFFTDISGMKYEASQTFKNAVEYADPNAGWVRYQDVINNMYDETEKNGDHKMNSEEFKKSIHVENETLVFESKNTAVGLDNVGNIPVESAFLLVYAAEDDGRIIRIESLGSNVHIQTPTKVFMEDNSRRESAKWEEALDRLINWGWVKAVGPKNEFFKLTKTGYDKADWLKERMEINTENSPLEEIKLFR